MFLLMSRMSTVHTSQTMTLTASTSRYPYTPLNLAVMNEKTEVMQVLLGECKQRPSECPELYGDPTMVDVEVGGCVHQCAMPSPHYVAAWWVSRFNPEMFAFLMKKAPLGEEALGRFYEDGGGYR